MVKDLAAAAARAGKLLKAQERQTVGAAAVNEYTQFADRIRTRTAKLRAQRLERDGEMPKSLAGKRQRASK